MTVGIQNFLIFIASEVDGDEICVMQLLLSSRSQSTEDRRTEDLSEEDRGGRRKQDTEGTRRRVSPPRGPSAR